MGWQGIVGNFLSFQFFQIPMADPLSVLQVSQITGMVTKEMLTGVLVVLGLAFFLGSVFCSWICPFGFLSEIVHKVASTPSWRLQNIFSRKNTAAKQINISNTKEELHILHSEKQKNYKKNIAYAFYYRLGIVLLGLFVCLSFFRQPILNLLSMPGWYSILWQNLAFNHFLLAFIAFTFVSSVLAAEFFYKKRIWCRYICPQSILIALSKALNPWGFRVFFNKTKCSCKGSRPCVEACSLALNPRSQSRTQKLACNNCGQCTETCQAYGKALILRFYEEKQGK